MTLRDGRNPVAQLRDRVLALTARALDVLAEGPRRSTQVGHDEQKSRAANPHHVSASFSDGVRTRTIVR